MWAFPLAFEFSCAGFGEGLVTIIEGLNGAATDVTNSPDDPHSRRWFGFDPALGGLGAGLADGWLVQAQSFGGLCGRSEVAQVQGPACHLGFILIGDHSNFAAH